MDDLISRSKVIDVLKETGIIQDNDLGHLVVEEIERIPTAYDVEKVLEQIISKSDSVTNDFGEEIDKTIRTSKAVDMIRKGGTK